MHSVSPVRIRTDTNLRNPMTATNFEVIKKEQL